MSSLYRQALLNQGRLIGPSPEKGTKQRDSYSDGRRSGPGRLQTAWSWVYGCSAFEWKQHFPEMVGTTFHHECDQLNDPIYTPMEAAGDLRAEENVAFAIAIRTRLVQRMVGMHPPMACTKAELRQHVLLTVKCIQSCLCNHANDVTINDPRNSDDNDELHAAHAAFEQRRADQLSSKLLRQANKTSRPQPSSGRKSLLGGPVYEQCPVKLDTKTAIPDMTIRGEETIFFGGAKGITGGYPRWVTIATVEVESGQLTLRGLRQSFGQGVAAALKDRINGSRQRTWSILINQTSMIVVEYALDDDFIKSVVESRREASQLLTTEIKGEFQVVYRGPFDLGLPEKLVRAVFIGLVAPDFRSHIDLATMQANLTTMLRESARSSLGACLHSSFYVPPGFKKFTSLPHDDDTTAADALWAACLAGKVLELREVTV